MPSSSEQRIRQYLDLIAGSDGTESVLATVEALAAESRLETFSADSGDTGGTAEKKLASARAGLESLAQGAEVPVDQLVQIEAIIIPALRPIYDIKNGSFSTVTFDVPTTPGHSLWTKLTTDNVVKQRIEALLPAIGRIELLWGTTIPYGGTGFIVGPNLLMTNRHVAQIFAMGLGERNLRFINGRAAGIDFRRDDAAGTVFNILGIKMVHPYWDMAVLEVEGLPAGITPLPLAVTDARDLFREEVVVIGYPAFDSRNPEDVQADMFGGRFGVKRLQPGLLQGGADTDSFGKIVRAATHDCSTTGGNSGSVVANLATGEIVGLHFAGRYLERNYAVPTGALARDQRVVDLGLNFAGKASGGPNDWGDWWTKSDNETVRAAMAAGDGGGLPPVTDKDAQTIPPADGGGGGGVVNSGGSITFEVPLRITVSLGAAPSQERVTEAVSLEKVSPPAPGGAFLPKSVDDYDDRAGYDENFLSGGTKLPPVVVPMPEAADETVLAQLKTGGTRLDYQNFSIKMHAKRRLALFAASNVTEEGKLREPVKGRNYSRQGLFSERWFPDLRLDDKFQIPDVFYTKDQGAFDKGHVVRRDDVAWGQTFELLLKGNVDSFHVTNCSPQVEGYNRSDSGERNWGDLENHVLSEAASERLCVFAGPVLADDDRIFSGKGPKGTSLRAPVPRRFWKVVVARGIDGLASYGFVLEQDLSDVLLEFAVADEFVSSMYRLSEISRLTGVNFHQSILDADQYDTVRGAEIALRAGSKRKGTATK
nr:DNA/RNA non-specific endonuclease [uncultured Shinella sp.]